MKSKIVAGLAFLLNTVLFATYYSVSKEALGRIDPIVFSYFEMMTLSPAALIILILSWQDMNRVVFKRGVLLGSSLCLALFTIGIALKYTSATSTAFFPCLNGFLAALISWLFLQQPVRKLTWFAGLLSVIGTILLVLNSSGGAWRGSVIAFLGGLFFTCYVFLADQEQKDEIAYWPLFGVELLTMAVWANLVALLFGDWQAVHPSLPKDVLVVLYVAGACTFLPTLITVLMQRHISPVTVSFIYILEPVLGAVVANIYLHEALPVQGYAGGALVVVGAIIHTWATAERPSGAYSIRRFFARCVSPSWIGRLVSPILCCGIGFLLLYKLGGVPPRAFRDLYSAWPLLPTFVEQGQGMFVFLLVLQAVSWLIAWTALVVLGLLSVYHLFRTLLFFEPGESLLEVQAKMYGEHLYQQAEMYGEHLETLPYAVPRRGEKTLVRRRRKDRLQRLGEGSSFSR